MVFVALGSNLGDRRATLDAALAALARAPGVSLVATSRVYETEPVGPPQGPYLNAVAELHTRLDPRELLRLLLRTEAAAGRRRTRRHGPRSLDLDLLFYGDRCLDEPDLVVPHPRLHERSFVLEPLCELAPDWVHPRLGRTVSELAEQVRGHAAVTPLPELREEA